MKNSAHHITTGDTIKIDSGQEFLIESGSILQFGDSDTVLFEQTGVTHVGPGESLIEEKDFANAARCLVVMLETYRHRRWVDLSLSEQGELTGIFSDLAHYHEIDHSKLAEHVGRQMLIDVFKKSVESYACLKEDYAE
jgi:hypothetical protein